MKKYILLAVAVTAALSVLAMGLGMAMLLRPTAIESAPVALEQVAGGTYIGVCQNKLLFAAVRVQVEQHQIIGIDVLYHKDSYLEAANQVAQAVVEAQSLEVDAVSGATFTSDTVRAAVRQALLQGLP